MTTCITMCSYKGGSGKSLVAANLAIALTLLGKKVALIDFDLRGPTLAFIFGVTGGNLNDYLIDNKSQQLYQKIPIHGDSSTTLYLIPSRIEPRIDEFLSNATTAKELMPRMVSMMDFLHSKNFDFVIIDNSSGISLTSMNSILIANYLVLVTRPTFFDIEGLMYTLEQIYTKLDEEVQLLLVINQIPRNSNIENIVTLIEQRLAKIHMKLASTLIHIPCYCEMPLEATRTPTLITKPDHPFSKHIYDMAKYFITANTQNKQSQN